MGPEWAGVVGGIVGGAIGAGSGALVQWLQNRGELNVRKLEFRREYQVDLLKELRLNLRELQDAVERAYLAAATHGVSVSIDRADLGGFSATLRDNLFPRNEWNRKREVVELMGPVPIVASRIRDDEIDTMLPALMTTFAALAEPDKGSDLSAQFAATTELLTKLNHRVRALLSQAENDLSNLLT